METFYEKCDRILNYLNEHYSPKGHILANSKFTEETGVNINDAAITFIRSKGYLRYTSYDITIMPDGIAFISNSSFVKEQQLLDSENKSKWYNSENAQKTFEDYPNIQRNAKLSLILAAISAVLALIALVKK